MKEKKIKGSASDETMMLVVSMIFATMLFKILWDILNRLR